MMSNVPPQRDESSCNCSVNISIKCQHENTLSLSAVYLVMYIGNDVRILRLKIAEILFLRPY
jgi:hypothetical protein